MIYKIIDFYHFLLRKFPSFFALIYAIIFKFYLKEISTKKKYKKRVIVLNKERFWSDLEELDKSNEIQFVYFDKKRISLLTEPFVKTVRKKMISSFWTDYKDETFFLEYLNAHSKFIFYFLKYLNFFIKFDTIITPSLWYLQDKAFEKSSNLLNKKFIILHKENTVDPNNFESKLKILNKKLIKFEPNANIVVYNNNVKKIIGNTKKINIDKIFTLGCPRTDNLVRLNDKYGRETKGYEKSDQEYPRSKGELFFDNEMIEKQKKLFFEFSNCKLVIEKISEISELKNLEPDEVIIFLDGGLLKIVDEVLHFATIPGDVGHGAILSILIDNCHSVSVDTIILRINKTL